jgi:hypothetical protein
MMYNDELSGIAADVEKELIASIDEAR